MKFEEKYHIFKLTTPHLNNKKLFGIVKHIRFQINDPLFMRKNLGFSHKQALNNTNISICSKLQ